MACLEYGRTTHSGNLKSLLRNKQYSKSVQTCIDQRQKKLPVKRLFKIVDFVMRYSQTDKDYIGRNDSLKFSN